MSAILLLLAGVGLSPLHAQTSLAPSSLGQVRLDARYTITMTGVSIGQMTWTSRFAPKDYETSTKGKASGLLSVLLDGEASLRAQGDIADDGHLVGSLFQSSIQDDDGNSQVHMMLQDGSVSDLVVKGPPPEKDRVPLKETDRHNIEDPLTAMLFDSNGGGNVMPAGICNRTLAIFDGARRYNLILVFKRRDKIAIERSYTGPVLVCGVTLLPISGHKASSAIVKYVAKKDDLEMWLAPVAGTSIAAPVRFRAPTLLGTLEIKAEKFEAIEQPALTPSTDMK